MAELAIDARVDALVHVPFTERLPDEVAVSAVDLELKRIPTPIVWTGFVIGLALIVLATLLTTPRDTAVGSAPASPISVSRSAARGRLVANVRSSSLTR